MLWDPRPKPPKKFDARSEAAVVALACSPPPPGRSRWSVVLLAKEVARQGIVASVGKNGPTLAEEPRAEAVAGKKCGACRS